jgi:hypothetical protein
MSPEKVRTIAELKKWLDNFPDNWRVWGYEGELTGIMVASPKGDPSGSYCFGNDGKDELPEPRKENQRRSEAL